MKAASRLPKPLPAVDTVQATPAQQPAGQEDHRPAAQAQRAQQAAINASPRQLRQRQSQPLATPNRTGLPAQLKAGVESLSGHSLDDVRVHYNSARPAQLQALAYAQGTDIHVAPGQEQHLPHEAWHVAQQKQGRVPATRQLKGTVPVNDDAGLEREADVMGAQALRQPASEGLQSQRPAQLRAVVQRRVLTKLVLREDEEQEETETPTAGEAPYILDVVIGGRTPSPFGNTMGAHSTAWVVHLDAVRRHLINIDLEDGARGLIGLAEHEIGSELLKLRDMLSEAHRTKLLAATLSLSIAIATVRHNLTGTEQPDDDDEKMGEDSRRPARTSWQPLVQAVRTLVEAYLTFVNYLPTSTVAGGDPSGHGEGSTRGELNLFESIHAGVERIDKLNEEQAQLQSALDELAEGEEAPTDTADQLQDIAKERKAWVDERKSIGSKGFAQELKEGAKVKFTSPTGDTEKDDTGRKHVEKLRKGMIERLWNMFAAETPHVFTQGLAQGPDRNDKIILTWGLMLREFLKSIRTAYPYAYRFTAMQTVAAQRQGLESSLAAAGQHVPAEILDAVLESLTNTPESAPAEPDYTGVAESDLQQSGSGFQANVMVAADGIIGDVVMNGRTPSPFSGTMGAHTTAWTVHVDAVRRLLTGKTVPAAFKALAAKAAAERSLNSRVLKLSDRVDEKHQVFLMNAYTDLRSRENEVADYATRSLPAQTMFLQEFIREYLSFLNFLPMSTISVGRLPNGRSEGQHRTFLNKYEVQGPSLVEDEEERKALLQEHLKGMFDRKALEDFPPNLGQREQKDPTDNIGMPFERHDLHGLMRPKKPSDTARKVSLARRRFYRTLMEAYPRSLMDSGLLTEQAKGAAPLVLQQEQEEIETHDRAPLEEMMHQNNCLINAIGRAGHYPAVTYEQLVAMRLRIGEVGTMLIASERVISIIREVLGITRGIVVVYPDRPSEDFGNTDVDPIMIRHTGHAHFEPGAVVEPSNERKRRRVPRSEAQETETSPEAMETETSPLLSLPVMSGTATTAAELSDEEATKSPRWKKQKAAKKKGEERMKEDELD